MVSDSTLIPCWQGNTLSSGNVNSSRFMISWTADWVSGTGFCDATSHFIFLHESAHKLAIIKLHDARTHTHTHTHPPIPHKQTNTHTDTHIHTCMQTFLPKSWASHLNSHLLTVRFSCHTQMQCSPGRLIDYTVYFLVQWHIVSEILLTPMFVWFQGTLNHQQQPRTHQVSAFAFHSPTLFVNRIYISLTYLMHDKLLIWSILMRCTFEWTQFCSDPHGNACIRTNMWTHCAQLRTQLAWHESQA